MLYYSIVMVSTCPEMIGLTVLIRSKNTDFPPYFVLYTAMGITGKSDIQQRQETFFVTVVVTYHSISLFFTL